MRSIPLPKAKLTKEAADIFDFLLAVNEHEKVGAVLRVAGGWVRDTLLGIPSNDIDIAIETLPANPPAALVTGETFTRSIAQYQAARQLPTNTISVIKTNPEKSKHIETAQMTVLGVPLEFCHLRHDDYTSESRVPTVRPGTPLEDALRRDYTVNALFYNIHTEMVEDYTSGLADMEARLLRTPLAPRETFLDDPLRLLRGIRFSGQLAYGLADDVVACAKDAELVAMMRDKVSRERIGIEFGKMMGGNKPSYCGGLLTRTGLVYNTVLQEVYYKKAKGKQTSNEIEHIRALIAPDASAEALAALDASMSVWAGEHLRFLVESLGVPKGNSRIATASLALLMPLALSGMLRPIDAKDGRGPAATLDERVAALVMHGLKQPGVVSDNAAKLLGAVSALLDGGDELLAAMKEQRERVAATLDSACSAVFVAGAARELWFDVLCRLSSKTMLEEGPLVALAAYLLAKGLSYHEIDCFVAVLRKDHNLLASPVSTTPLRGDDVSAALGVEKKKTALYIMAQRRHLLHHPCATREEMIEYLKTLSL